MRCLLVYVIDYDVVSAHIGNGGVVDGEHCRIGLRIQTIQLSIGVKLNFIIAGLFL